MSGFSCDTAVIGANASYYQAATTTNPTTAMARDTLSASAGQSYYVPVNTAAPVATVFNGSERVPALTVTATAAGYVVASQNLATNSQGVGPYGASGLPEIAGTVGYQPNATQYNRDGNYFIASTSPIPPAPVAPSAPDAPDAFTTVSSAIPFFNSGNVTGTQPITYSFLYGLADPPTIPSEAFQPEPSLSIEEGDITGLTNGTTYYVRSVATNSVGSTQSASATFTTKTPGGVPPSAPPTVAAFVSATPTSITVSMDITGITGTPTPTYTMQYGVSPTSINLQSVTFTAVGNILTFVISGLLPSTPYYFASTASNGAGVDTSAVSPPYSTTAEPPIPPTSPEAPTAFPRATSAVVYFNSLGVSGAPPITYSFLWGTSNPPTIPIPATQANPNLTVEQAIINGLAPNTTYFVQSVATNAIGSSASPATQFQTLPAGNVPPTAAPTVPAFVSSTPSSIVVTIDISGITGTPTPIYSVAYGTSPTNLNLTDSTSSAVGNVLTFTINSLQPSTQYFFAAVAQNSAGSKTSATSAAYSTQPTPPPTPQAPSAPAAPDVFPASTSAVCFFSSAGVTGDAPITFSFLWGQGILNTPAVATQPNPALSIWETTLTGLTAASVYNVVAVATNAAGATQSTQTIFNTLPAAVTPPSAPPTVPAFVSATTSSITVSIDTTGITGSAPIAYAVLYGTTTSPTVTYSTSTAVGNILTFVVPGLAAATNYYFKAVAQNAAGVQTSLVSAAYATSVPPPATALVTNCCIPFLIQGPRFNTPYATAIDYYVNVDAVGCTQAPPNPALVGAQEYGYMFATSQVTPGQTFNSGLCTSDQPYSQAYGPTTDAFFTSLGAAKKLISWGGFYADILGLFGPYQPVGFPGTNNSSVDIVNSFCSCYLRLPGANPLSWSNTGWNTTFDGLVLDFENVGLGGNPNVNNTYPQPQNPAPAFPASATDPKYAPYIAALAAIPTAYRARSPNGFLGNAPVSLSINGDILVEGAATNGNIGAANSALNTWFAFPDSVTVPSAATYNSAASSALNHPSVMCLFDDIFVQFYNESSSYYPGGAKFNNLLAQWGYVALQAQKLGQKKTTINIGLAKGNIIPGGNPPVANAQGPTPPLPNQAGPPYTYWYPQYATRSPPNSINVAQNALFWPNTGLTEDPANVANAIDAANSILQTATGNPNLQPSDWCSGMGFWAGSNATNMAQNVYDKNSAFTPGPNLPSKYVYCWADASYPSPATNWPANVPIVNNLNAPTAPSSAPPVPSNAGSTSTSITMFYDSGGVTGVPTPAFSLLYGTTTNPTTPFTTYTGTGVLTFVVTGLTPSTTYYFKSVASNPSGTLASAVSAPHSTTA